MNAPTPNALAARAERVTARAWVDMFDAVPAATRSILGLEHRAVTGRDVVGARPRGGHEATSTVLVAGAVDHMLLNRTLLGATAHIAGVMEAYDRAGVHRCLLSIGAEWLPAALSAAEPHGLVRFRRPWGTLVHTVTDPAPPVCRGLGVTLRRARRSDTDEVAGILCPAFDLPTHAAPVFAAVIGRPRWEVVVAECDGRVAATGFLFVDGGAACLVAGATAPAYRRRGLQGALVAHRVRVARDAGATLVCSETGIAIDEQPNSSWDNLVRAGLRPAGLSEHLCRRGASWSAR